MFEAFTAANFSNFAGCSASTSSSSPFSIPSILPLPLAQTSTALCANAAPHSMLCSAPSAAAVAHAPLLGSGKRERTKYSESQLRYLDGMFRQTKYPDVQQREQIAKCLQLTDVKVQVWFKNRRAKDRNEKKMEQMRRGGTTMQHKSGGGGDGTTNGLKTTENAVLGNTKSTKRRSGNDERMLPKREESVEDTEEENQQPERKKAAMDSRDTETAETASCAFASSSSSEQNSLLQSPLSASSSASFSLPYGLQKSLRIPQTDSFVYNSNLPSSSSSYPSATSSVEMGSLMAVASGISQQVHPFYGAWPGGPSGYPSSLLSSSYVPSGQVAIPQQFGSLVHPPAYYQTNNYYFHQSATQQQSAAAVAAIQRFGLEPKNETE